MKHLSLLAALLLAALPLSSCSGGDPKELTNEGQTALNSGDPGGALAKFQKALAKLEPGDTGYLEAKIGELRALAYSDAPQATQQFLALAKERSLPSDIYRSFVTDLASAGAFDQAVEVLTAGKAAHPQYAKWQELIQSVGDRAVSAGAEGALKGLEGLGYVGND